MHQPKFNHQNDVWDNNEEATRGRHQFPLTTGDIVELEQDNDGRRRHQIVVSEVIPFLLEGVNAVHANHAIANNPEVLFERHLFISVMYNYEQNHEDVDARISGSHPLEMPSGYVKDLVTTHNRSSDMTLPCISTPDDNLISIYRGEIECQNNETMNKLFLLLNQNPREFKVFWNFKSCNVSSYRSLVMILILAASTKRLSKLPYSIESLLLRASQNLVGRRGILRGWASTLPDVWGGVLDANKLETFQYPDTWCSMVDSDGDSSFRSDSPGGGKANRGSACSGSEESGPGGVAPGKLYTTGFSSTSESEDDSVFNFPAYEMSNLNDSVDNTRRCVNRNVYPFEYIKKFNKFMKRTNKERHERKYMRRARRWVRTYFDRERRLDKPWYDKLVRRAENLAAEIMLIKMHEDYNKTSSVESMFVESLDVELSNNDDLSCDQTMDEGVIIKNPERPKERVCGLARKLEIQLYGKLLKFHKERKLTQDPEMCFRCTITPVRFVKQTGPR